jgi:tRNA A-37 threonylcarbamoyl transferase component Bud32
MVLRLNRLDHLLPGSSRKVESVVLDEASQSGIAPPLLFIDEEAGYLVSIYIDNLPGTRTEITDHLLDQLFDLLGRCHRLQADVPTLDYLAHVNHYWQQIDAGPLLPPLELADQKSAMETEMTKLSGYGAMTGLCHHDPIPGNFVGGPDRLYLVDWEYSARGLIVMDYAALVIEWKINDAEVLARTGIAPPVLDSAKMIYQYLCALWEETARGKSIS